MTRRRQHQAVDRGAAILPFRDRHAAPTVILSAPLSRQGEGQGRGTTRTLALNLTRELFDLASARRDDALDVRARALSLTHFTQ